MSEHSLRRTLEASVWCVLCYRNTPRGADTAELGPCLVCTARAEAELEAMRNKQAEEQKRHPGLFDEPVL